MSRSFQFHFERLPSRTLLSHGFGALDSFDKIERDHVHDHEQVEVRKFDNHNAVSGSQHADSKQVLLRWSATDSLTNIESTSGKNEQRDDEEQDESGSRGSDESDKPEETTSLAWTESTSLKNTEGSSESDDHNDEDRSEEEKQDKEDSRDDDQLSIAPSPESHSKLGKRDHEESEDSSSERDDDHSSSHDDAEDDSDEDEHSGDSINAGSNSGSNESDHEESGDSSSESDDDQSGSDDDDHQEVHSNSGNGGGGADGSNDSAPDEDNDEAGEEVDSSGPGSGLPAGTSPPAIPSSTDGGGETEHHESESSEVVPKIDDHLEVTSPPPLTTSSNSANTGSTGVTPTESQNNPSVASNPENGPVVLPSNVNNAGASAGPTVVPSVHTVTSGPVVVPDAVTSDSPEVQASTTTPPVTSPRAGNSGTTAQAVAGQSDKSNVTTSVASSTESDDTPAIVTNPTTDKRILEQRSPESANHSIGAVATRANGHDSTATTNSPERHESKTIDKQSPRDAATDERIADVPVTRPSTPVTTVVPTTSPVWTTIPQWLVESLANLESSELFPTSDQLEKVWNDAHSLVDQTSELFVESGSLSWLLAGGAAMALVVTRRGTKTSCDDRPWLELAPGLIDDAFTK